MHTFQIVRYATCLQLTIVFLSVPCYFILRALLQSLEKRNQRIEKKIHTFLESGINLTLEIVKPNLRFLKKNYLPLLHCISAIDKKAHPPKNWKETKQFLSDKILKPTARKLVRSRHWEKQFIAVLCYEYGVDEKDAGNISRLVHNERLIISLNTARIIFLFPTTRTVNTLINAHAKERRIQQFLYAEILALSKTPHLQFIISIIISRIKTEENTYIKAFCYRTLTLLKAKQPITSLIKKDLYSSSIELRIASTSYLANIKTNETQQLLVSLLDDERKEIRAVAARLLANFPSQRIIPILEAKLRDEVWWVRINAANTLATFGTKGIHALERQSPEIDKFAYETAQKILISHQQQGML